MSAGGEVDCDTILKPQKAPMDVRHAKSHCVERLHRMVALRGRKLRDPSRIFPCDMKTVVYMPPRAVGSQFKKDRSTLHQAHGIIMAGAVTYLPWERNATQVCSYVHGSLRAAYPHSRAGTLTVHEPACLSCASNNLLGS